MEDFAKKYFDVLRGTLASLNLTSIKDFNDFYQKQVKDSILPLEHSQKFVNCLDESKLMVDVGPGGGFPLLPMAFKRRDIAFLGLEARKKKVEAIELIKKALDLDFVKVFQARIEEIVINKKCLLTFKAVGTCKECLEKIRVNIPPSENVYVFFFKGPKFHDLEGADLKRGFPHWQMIEEKFMPLEGTEGRWLIGFQYDHSSVHSQKGPRHSQNKELVNLSHFL